MSLSTLFGGWRRGASCGAASLVFCYGCLGSGCAARSDEGAATSAQGASDRAPASGGTPAAKEKIMSTRTYKKPSEDELKKRLSPLEYQVTQHDATEPPFRNKFWDNHEAGLYVDVASGEPLFSSLDKFESGTGWPSFTRAVDDVHVIEKRDVTHGMTRVEVRSKDGNSHLGHLFDDGPEPTGQRFCINSASLRFIPKDKLEAEGYGEYAALFRDGAEASVSADTANACATPPPGEKAGCETTLETAMLAGGCFWGMEEILRGIPGVLETEVGYTGGSTKKPTYKDIKTGTTGHAESVRIVFDPKTLSYADLLEKWFFKMHDPTTEDRQGNDVGSSYRSAIFATTPEQKKVALEVKERIDKSGKWEAPLVTQIVDAGDWTPAEGYHQDYLQTNPGGYTCHWMRD